MNWAIETIEKAREIYQARHGGDYFENGEIFKRVTAALLEAAQQTAFSRDEPFTLTDLPRPWSTDEMKSRPTPLTMDGATVAEFCECGISIESHTGVYCIFRPASNVPGICQCGYMAKYPICTKCGRTYPPKKDSL